LLARDGFQGLGCCSCRCVRFGFQRCFQRGLQCKAAYFSSQAQYNKSLQDTSAGRYGDAVSRLTLGQEAAKDATRFASGFMSVFAPGLVPTLPADSVASLNEITKLQHALVSTALTNAKRENDLIYHASPTSEASLAVIEKTAVSEPPTTIQEIYAAPEVQKTVGQDIFIKLVPLAVTESASMYSEEKAKLVRGQAEAVEVANGQLTNALEYLGLPSSLVKFKHAANTALDLQQQFMDPGPQIKGWSQQVSAQEASSTTIASLLTSLQQLRSKAGSSVDAILTQLDAEERECESTRRQYADAGFEQAPASAVPEFKAYKADAKARKETLQSAASSDEVIFRSWEQARGDIGLLGDWSALERWYQAELGDKRAKQDLLADLSSGDQDAGQDGDVARRVEVIEELVERLKQMKAERLDVLKDLKERTQADDISHLLILNRKTQNIEPTLFATELEKFRGHQARISSTINHESSTIQELFKEFKDLTEGSAQGREIQSKWANAERKRRELSERMSKAFAAYEEVRGGAAYVRPGLVGVC
jgi:tyrosine-protein phosphatase non-receptor type 23